MHMHIFKYFLGDFVRIFIRGGSTANPSFISHIAQLDRLKACYLAARAADRRQSAIGLGEV
jgi:hypothetical protein